MRTTSSVIFTYCLAAVAVFAAPPPGCPDPLEAVNLYRGRNPTTGNTFYSTTAAEIDNIGVPADTIPLARIFPTPGTPPYVVPLYRYVATLPAGEDDHYYTRENAPTLVKDGITYAQEGPQGYVYSELGFSRCNKDLTSDDKLQPLLEYYSPRFTDHAYVLKTTQPGETSTDIRGGVFLGYGFLPKRLLVAYVLPPPSTLW
ncbi:hypothetical protein HGRIS_003638 [Hohenbuehelia grisea]|uniref:DUF5648 domain-containing protein n=1 Tax=Hohenbuehelia grisea TaxID=104357 RepID=A0ABR3JGW0_9AGAR